MRNASTQIFVNGDHHDDSSKKRTRSQNLCRKIRRKAEGSTDKCKTYARTSRRGLWGNCKNDLQLGSCRICSELRFTSWSCKSSEIEKYSEALSRKLKKFENIHRFSEYTPLTFTDSVNIIAIVNSAMANPNKSQPPARAELTLSIV